MAKEGMLARNIGYSAGSAMSNMLLVALVLIAARLLGDRSFGHFSFALALASVFETMIDLGLNLLATRNVARDRGLVEEYLHNILGWKLVLSTAAMGLLVVAVHLLGGDPEARTAAYILGVAVVLRSFKSTSHAFFQAYERFDLVLLTTYVERVSVLVFGLAALWLTRSLIAFCMVFALIRIPDMLFSYWLMHRKIAPVRIRLRREVVKKLQVAAIPFGVCAVVSVMYASTGTLVLSNLRPPEQVGWYNAGYKIYEGLTMFPFLICAVLMPRLSRLYEEDREAHQALSLRMMRYMFLISVPIAVTVGLLAPQAILLLFGSDYLPAVPALRVLLATTVLMFGNWLMNTVLVSAGRESLMVRITSVGLGVMVVSNLLLVRAFGLHGAAYSVAISESVVFTLMLLTVRKMVFPMPAHHIAWRPVAACLSAGAVLLATGIRMPAGLVLLFGFLYLALLLVLRAFTPDELQSLKNFVLSRATWRR